MTTPLVLLHGFALNGRVFDDVRTACAAHLPTLAPDLPGHGRAPWPERGPRGLDDLADAVLATLPARCALLGWSLGGQVALTIAARAPERIERLVLVSTTPRFLASDDWPHGVPSSWLDDFGKRLRTDYDRTVSDFLDLQVRGSTERDRVLHVLRHALLDHGHADPRALELGLDVLRHADLRDSLASLRTPTLVIGGQYDRVTMPAAAKALAAAIPGASGVELRRAGHAPFLSHPGEFVAAVTGFLRRAAA